MAFWQPVKKVFQKGNGNQVCQVLLSKIRMEYYLLVTAVGFIFNLTRVTFVEW